MKFMRIMGLRPTSIVAQDHKTQSFQCRHLGPKSNTRDNDMGDWNIMIQGTGCHHNADNPGDAEKLAAGFVKTLKENGHSIDSATFTCGARMDLKPKVTTTTGVSPENVTYDESPRRSND